MRFTHTLITAALIGFGAIAHAGPEYMAASKQVADMIVKSKTPTTTDEARKYYADAERMMKEGKEKEAMQLLEQAKKLLSAAK